MGTTFLEDGSIVGFKAVVDFYNIINNLTLFPESESQASRHFDAPRTPYQHLPSLHATEERAWGKHTSRAFYIRHRWPIFDTGKYHVNLVKQKKYLCTSNSDIF